MKPQEVFDVCHGRYRSLRQFLKGRIAAVDLDTPSSGYRWRPDRARAEEFCADYEMISERALSRPEWKGRRKLFRIYFLWGAEYRRAITLVGVSEGTFDYWLDEVKKTLGRAFERAGLFPPGEYFRQRNLILTAVDTTSSITMRPIVEDSSAAMRVHGKRSSDQRTDSGDSQLPKKRNP